MPVIPATWKVQVGGGWSNTRPYLNVIRVGGVVEVVECLPNKYKALTSNPRTRKNIFT
jgi:hypothetical protein